MFAEFRKESMIVIRCAAYWILIAVLTAVFFTQYREDVNYDLKQARSGILFEETRWGGTDNNLLVKPDPDADRYGSVDAEVPGQVMRNVTYRLFRDTSNNEYDTYLFGVIPAHRKLDREERQRVFDIFEKITGTTIYQVDAEFYRMDLAKVLETGDMTEKQARDFLRKNYFKELADEFEPNHRMTLLYEYEEYIPIREDLSYEEFKRLIGEVKGIIGRKTADYENLERYGARELTYEEALSRYEAFVYEDGVSGAYARLFCDDLGFAAGLIPVFIAVERTAGGLLRRKKERKAASLDMKEGNQIWASFLSIVIMTMIPILIYALAATFGLAAGVRPIGLNIDYFAFIGYSVAWLLPTVMFAAAIGMLSAVLAIKPAGILVQCSLWLWSSVWGEKGRSACFILALLLITAAWYIRKRQVRRTGKPTH